MPISYRSEFEIEKLRKANGIVVAAHREVAKRISSGVKTLELDKITETVIRDMGGRPSFKGYRGYPASVCVSINDEVVHGIPGQRRLKDGDIVGVDIGVEYEGYYGDAAWTLPVGEISKEAAMLLKVTKESLDLAVAQMKVGGRLSDISYTVESHALKHGYSVVKSFVGHGIGTSPHEDPQVPNFGKAGRGPELKAGMVLAIEPMVNIGRSDVKVLDDGWTVVTIDGSLSAHFEYSVALTKEGPSILSDLN